MKNKSKEMKKGHKNLILLVVVLSLVFGVINQSFGNPSSFNTGLTSSNIKTTVTDKKYDDISNIAGYQLDFFIDEKPRITACDSKSIGQWEKYESERLKGLLKNKSYDLIVLPVQEINPTNDRIGRVLASRLIANAISKTTNQKVLSPEMALRLLGGKQILFDTEKVNELASELSTDVVYLLKRKINHVLDDKNNPLSSDVELAAILTDSKGKIRKKILLNIGKDNIRERRNYKNKDEFKKYLMEPQETLELQVGKVGDLIAQELFQGRTNSAEKKTYTISSFLNLPEEISKIPQVAKSPIENAAYFQLLAILTPENLEYERKRLFERSLLALQFTNKESDYYNVLYARALFHLYRRPFALPYLESPTAPAEIALKKYINGNLPGLEETVAKIQDPLLHTLATIELNSLRYEYKKKEKRDSSYLVPSSEWITLIETSSRNRDAWYAPDILNVLAEIKSLYPNFEKQFDKALKGITVTNNTRGFNLNVQVLSSLFFSSNIKLANGPEDQYAEEITEVDIWNLYRNLSIGLILKNLKFSVTPQGSYSRAMEKAKSLEIILGGHPEFMYLYGHALLKSTLRMSGLEKQTFLKKSCELGERVLAEACGVSETSHATEFLFAGKMSKIAPEGKNYFSIPSVYSGPLDLGVYPTSYLQSGGDSARLGLPFTNTRLDSLIFTSSKLTIEDPLFKREYETRFNGHPEKIGFLAKRYSDFGKKDKAISFYKKAIENGEETWEVYSGLGLLFFSQGKYEEAHTTFLSYPGFLPPQTQGRVGTSNGAFLAGDLFYNIGFYEEAVPLFEIAASLSTGASSHYSSIQKLAVIKRDFETALKYSQINGERYGDMRSYNQYLTFLHLFGLHEESEAAFHALSKRRYSENLWPSMLTGNRVQERDLKSTLDATIDGTGNLQKNIPFIRYLAENINLDRLPTEDDLAFLNNIEGGERLKVTRNYFAGGTIKILQPEINNLLKNSRGAHRKLRLGSYSTFTKALSAFLNEDYAECVKIARPYYSYNSKDNDPIKLFMLPYYLLSAIQSKLPQNLEKMYDNLSFTTSKGSDNVELFEFYVCQAIIRASMKEHKEAISYLQKAFTDFTTRKITYDKYRPTDKGFKLLLITERLSHIHNDTRYIEKAIDWAMRYQRISPQSSWAYSFEALYGKEKERRVQAAAFANYLDSKSKWLSKVPEDILEQSTTWWKDNNPFRFNLGNQKINNVKKKI